MDSDYAALAAISGLSVLAVGISLNMLANNNGGDMMKSLISPFGFGRTSQSADASNNIPNLGKLTLHSLKIFYAKFQFWFYSILKWYIIFFRSCWRYLWWWSGSNWKNCWYCWFMESCNWNERMWSSSNLWGSCEQPWLWSYSITYLIFLSGVSHNTIFKLFSRKFYFLRSG